MSASRILVVDDEADIRGLLKEILSEEGYEVDIAADASQARSSRAAQVPDLVLLDIWMPDTDGITLLREWSHTDGYDCPVVMMSGHGTVETAVEATRLGAFDFVEKPLSLTKLLRTVERALDAGRRNRLSARTHGPSLAMPIGKAKVTQLLREQVQHAATSSSPVLLLGELGSGREAYARYLHSLSARAAKPFHSVVAASFSADPAAVLFGSERDGRVEPGALDQAAGGSLSIAGLEDLNSEAQRALLGAIEQNSYTRVGGRQKLPLNVRWISSAQDGFELRTAPEPWRRDLIANLNVIMLRVPPLRDYAEDVPDLLRFYVDRLVDDQHLPLRRFSVAAQNRLRNYPWPGNIDELKNLVQRVLVLGVGEEIGLEEIERELAVKMAVNEPLVKQDLLALPLREAREQFERAYLQQQLLLCNGKVGQLAKRVGMERTHLYRKLRALGVDFRQLGEDCVDMSMSLYAVTVPTYLQTLGAVLGLVNKAEAHCSESHTAPADLIQARLAADMLPFAYQVKSTCVHSLGAIEGVRRGVFSPDTKPAPETFADLQALVNDTVVALASIKAEEIDAFMGRPMRFSFGERHIDFAAEDFLLTFSQPNFYFHAATAYDILRWKGLKLTKRDFMGRLRIKNP